MSSGFGLLPDRAISRGRHRGRHAPSISGTSGIPDSHNHAGPAWSCRSIWPREESNLRTQLRRLPLCPLSYGAPEECRRPSDAAACPGGGRRATGGAGAGSDLVQPSRCRGFADDGPARSTAGPCLGISPNGQTVQRRGGAPQPPSPGNNRRSILGGIVGCRASSATPSYCAEKSRP
jgi:hypothetical protein